MLIQRFEKNVIGNDYIVGDIHGCYTRLYQKLHEMEFNIDKDRLFCTGDLVDRGPESIECLDILAQSWFHTVLGNHDQMACDWVDLKDDFHAMSPKLYAQNGGQWFMDLDIATQHYVADKLRELPVIIEIETDVGLVGIIHADCPFRDWENIKLQVQAKSYRTIEQCLWNREKVRAGNTMVVQGIHKVFHGHTVADYDFKLGNRHYIDTGAVFDGGYFTILKL